MFKRSLEFIFSLLIIILRNYLIFSIDNVTHLVLYVLNWRFVASWSVVSLSSSCCTHILCLEIYYLQNIQNIFSRCTWALVVTLFSRPSVPHSGVAVASVVFNIFYICPYIQPPRAREINDDSERWIVRTNDVA